MPFHCSHAIITPDPRGRLAWRNGFSVGSQVGKRYQAGPWSATAIRDARKQLDRGRLVVLTAGVPYKCPAAPYEAALLLDHDLRKRKLRDRVEVAVYAWDPAPMGVAGPEISGAVLDLLGEQGIPYHPGHQVTSVDWATGTLHFGNGAAAHFDLLVYVPPHVAQDVVKRAGLLGESGWAPVDRHTMETGSQGVYPIGDLTGIPLAIGMPLPKAGVFAHHQAEAVAQTIASEITGNGNGGRYEGARECFIEIGGGKAGFGRGNSYAEPSPMAKLHRPTRYWHAAKVLFEKDWFRRWLSGSVRSDSAASTGSPPPPRGDAGLCRARA